MWSLFRWAISFFFRCNSHLLFFLLLHFQESPSSLRRLSCFQLARSLISTWRSNATVGGILDVALGGRRSEAGGEWRGWTKEARSSRASPSFSLSILKSVFHAGNGIWENFKRRFACSFFVPFHVEHQFRRRWLIFIRGRFVCILFSSFQVSCYAVKKYSLRKK